MKFPLICLKEVGSLGRQELYVLLSLSRMSNSWETNWVAGTRDLKIK